MLLLLLVLLSRSLDSLDTLLSATHLLCELPTYSVVLLCEQRLGAPPGWLAGWLASLVRHPGEAAIGFRHTLHGISCTAQWDKAGFSSNIFKYLKCKLKNSAICYYYYLIIIINKYNYNK